MACSGRQTCGYRPPRKVVRGSVIALRIFSLAVPLDSQSRLSEVFSFDASTAA